MKGRAVWCVVLAVAVGLVVGPAFAGSPTCPDDGDAARCSLDCTLCLCCSHVPRTTPPFVHGGPAADPAGSVGADALVVPPVPSPRDILHVPKPLPPR